MGRKDTEKGYEPTADVEGVKSRELVARGEAILHVYSDNLSDLAAIVKAMEAEASRLSAAKPSSIGRQRKLEFASKLDVASHVKGVELDRARSMSFSALPHVANPKAPIEISQEDWVLLFVSDLIRELEAGKNQILTGDSLDANIEMVSPMGDIISLYLSKQDSGEYLPAFYEKKGVRERVYGVLSGREEGEAGQRREIALSDIEAAVVARQEGGDK